MDFSFWTKFPPLELSGLLRSSKVDLISGSTAECWCDRHRGGSTWVSPDHWTGTHKKTKQEPKLPHGFLMFLTFFFFMGLFFLSYSTEKKHHVAYIRSVVFLLFVTFWYMEGFGSPSLYLEQTDRCIWCEAVFDASALRIIRGSIRCKQRQV